MTIITDYLTASQTISGSQKDWTIATEGMISVQQNSDVEVDAVTENGSDNTLMINGIVAAYTSVSSGGAGVLSTGTNFALTVAKGGILQGWSYGADLQGADSHIINFGLIDGTEGFGVSISGANAILENHGSIIGINTGILVDHGKIVNDGSISARTYAVGAYALGSSIDLTNHGTIHALVAVASGEGADKIVNDGSIIGDLNLDVGKDTVDTRGGTIKGQILTGPDNDTLITDSAKIKLTEASDGGLDTVKSTVSYTLNTNVEVLTLIGKANINGTGTDGNVGREYLNGNAGANMLSGLAGNDVLDGKGGNDVLVGGAGLDLFVFKKGYGTETINDFHHSESDHVIIAGISDFSQIEDKLEKHGSDTWVNLGHGDIVVIKHIAPGELDHSDFGL